MKHTLCQKCLVVTLLTALGSCTTPKNTKVDYTTVEKTIIRGETRQNDVIQLMGTPNIVTKNSKGEEVWTYTKKSYNPETGDVAGGVIRPGKLDTAPSGTTTAAFDLILTFDRDNIVRDYNVVSSDF
jgi:hypothetical protein